MAGIYIHAPFCKTRCTYHGFYFTMRSERKGHYIGAPCKELEVRYTYLKGEPIETLHSGGDTPSQLDEEDFRKVFDIARRVYGIRNCHEITLEANPGDLYPEYMQMLSRLPFSRISMGIQTFDDTILMLLKQRHNAIQAIRAVELCHTYGFRSISIDLTYGFPGGITECRERDLQQAVALDMERVSAYYLTCEEDIPIYRVLQKYQVGEVDEDSSVRLFTLLTDRLQEAGYEHYEISNLCKPGMYSCHNTSYWRGTNYLGCGPSACSFDGATHEWNHSSMEKYIAGIEGDKRDFGREKRDLTTRYDEFIITSARTQWGISLERLRNDYEAELEQYCLKMARPSLEDDKLEIHEDALCLIRERIFISDSIMSDLLRVDN